MIRRSGNTYCHREIVVPKKVSMSSKQCMMGAPNESRGARRANRMQRTVAYVHVE